jgi:hypothetical protein
MGRRSVVAAASPIRDAAQLSADLGSLRGLPLAELRHRWRTLGCPSLPKTLPAFLVLRLVAYKMQAQRFGELNAGLRKALIQHGRGETFTPPSAGAVGSAPRTLVAGTLLTREWNGHVHHVMVLAEGFAWNGQTFGSLSEVARAITGTRWSGPVFFGLKTKEKMREGKPKAAARTRSRDPAALGRVDIGIGGP